MVYSNDGYDGGVGCFEDQVRFLSFSGEEEANETQKLDECVAGNLKDNHRQVVLANHSDRGASLLTDCYYPLLMRVI